MTERLEALVQALGLPEGTEVTFSVEGSKGASVDVSVEVESESLAE